jgi:hypothetical protein
MRRIALWGLLGAVVALLIGGIGPAAAVEVGDKAPDFELPATTQENPLKLSDFRGKKNVVLFGFIAAYGGP